MKPKQHWHREAKRFFKDLHGEYAFTEAEERVVDGACESLSAFWMAADDIQTHGAVTASDGGIRRQNPAAAVQKTAWASFLAALRHLGVCLPDKDPKRAPGRPPGPGKQFAR